MKHVIAYAKREWEQVTCLLALVLVVVLALDWGFTANETDAPDAPGKLPEYTSAFSPDAFGFLQKTVATDPPGRNPFRFAMESDRPRPAPKTQPKPEPEPVAPPDPEPAPEPQPDPVHAENPPVPVTPVPQIRRAYCDVKFVFNTTNRSGKPVALIELQNPARPGSTPLAQTVSTGDVLYGLQIGAFTDQALVLLDAAGKKQRIAFGRSRRVVVLLAPGL